MIESAVIDAGPLIHLHELNCVDLIEGFGVVHVPIEVKNEVARHRSGLILETLPGVHIAPTASVSLRVATYSRILDLDLGEIAALNLLEQMRGQLFLCDDAAARLAAESLGYPVHGTIGLIIRAIRRGNRNPQEVKSILEKIPIHSMLHVSRDLLRKVIASLPG